MKERDHLEDLNVGGRTILKCNFRSVWIGWEHGPMAGSCEHDNEFSRTIHVGKFIGHLGDHQFLKNDSAQWSYVMWA